MKKKLIDWVLMVARLLYRNKKYRLFSRKINLACGMTCAQGWFNIDGSLSALLGSKRFSRWNKLVYRLAGSAAYYSFEKFDDILRNKKTYFYDLRYGIPVADNQAEIVYCSHFLEHLNKQDGIRFLAECRRILAPGGLLRLVVPDLDVAFRQYRDGQTEKMLDLFFYTSEYADFAAHKYNYNYTLLRERLQKAGFSRITRKKYRQGQCPDLKILDSYPEHSLYVECRK